MKLYAFLLTLLTVPATAQVRSAHFGTDGHLIYAPKPRGDRMADFSYAGY